MRRFWEVDFFRGIALVMMVAYHSAWNSNHFFGTPDVFSGAWKALQVATGILFVTIAGVSMALSHQIHGSKKRIIRHGAKVFLWGMAATLITRIFMGSNFVKFGVLHLIGLSLMVSFPLAGKKWANFGISIATIPLGFYLVSRNFPFNLFFLGIKTAGFSSLDYYPLLPWFGFIALGMFLGNMLYTNGKRNFKIFESRILSGFSRVIGSNTLAIYLLHQPILFGLAWAAKWLLR